jgi:putative FmdB family regulatory protein
MARYDYQCDKCNLIKEIERPITSNEQPVVCECGKQMCRIYSTPTIKFNGEGWQTNEVKGK